MTESAVDSELKNCPPGSARALRDARLATLFLLANLCLQLVIAIASPLWQARPSEGEESLIPRTPGREWYLLVVGNSVLTVLPGCVLMFRATQSRRWQVAATTLLFAVGVELSFVVGLSVLRPHDVPVGRREAIGVRLLLYGLNGLHWLQLWTIAVLLAETFLWRQQPALVQKTEGLGYIVLAGFGVAMFWFAWTVASPPDLTDPDAVSLALLVGNDLLGLVAMVQTMRLLLVAESVLRFHWAAAEHGK